MYTALFSDLLKIERLKNLMDIGRKLDFNVYHITSDMY